MSGGVSRGRPRARAAIAVMIVALLLVVGACGSSTSNNTSPSSAAPNGSATTTTTRFAKTKFVLHAGLAFGAFHRWIYKPLKAGELTHPLTHKLTTLKAAAAALFTYHELKLALAAAQADPTLSHLVAPITALQSKISGLGSSLKSGSVDASQIENANGSIGSIHSAAAAAGHPITEQAPAIP